MPDVALPISTAPPNDPVRIALSDSIVRQKLLILAYTLVRGRGIDHEEVVQIAITRALAVAHNYVPERGTVLVWLTGFVRHIVQEQLKKRLQQMKDERNPDHLPARQTDEVELADLVRLIRDCLDQLPEPLRQAVHLRYLLELDYPDLASKLGISEAAARQRVSRGINMLRTLATKEAS